MISQSQTVPLELNFRQDLRNCEVQKCSQFVLYDYLLDTRPVISAKLKLCIRFARNLVKIITDVVPNPYVRVDALQFNGVTKIAYSRTIFNTTDPVWNHWINFDYRAWKLFYIQVFDEEIGRDERLSGKQIINLDLGIRSSINQTCYGRGHFIFEYVYTTQIVYGREDHEDIC